MFTDPAVPAGAVRVDGHVLGGEVGVVRRSGVTVREVVAAHDACEPVVVGQGERLGPLIAGPILHTGSRSGWKMGNKIQYLFFV